MINALIVTAIVVGWLAVLVIGVYLFADGNELFGGIMVAGAIALIVFMMAYSYNEEKAECEADGGQLVTIDDSTICVKEGVIIDD